MVKDIQGLTILNGNLGSSVDSQPYSHLGLFFLRKPTALAFSVELLFKQPPGKREPSNDKMP